MNIEKINAWQQWVITIRHLFYLSNGFIVGKRGLKKVILFIILSSIYTFSQYGKCLKNYEFEYLPQFDYLCVQNCICQVLSFLTLL